MVDELGEVMNEAFVEDGNADFVHNQVKEQLTPNIVDELQEVLKEAFFENGHDDKLHDQVKTDLKALMINEIQAEMRGLMETLKLELQNTLKDDLRQQLKREIADHIVNEIKIELKEELEREFRTSMERTLKAEYRIACSANRMQELIQEAKTNSKALPTQGRTRKLEDAIRPETDEMIRKVKSGAKAMVVAPATEATACPSKPPTKKRKTSRK
jgi:hypothetical protein